MVSEPKPYEIEPVYFRLIANAPQTPDGAERAALFDLAVMKVQQGKERRAARYRMRTCNPLH